MAYAKGLVFLLIAGLAACGEGPKSSPGAGGAGATGVEISGTIAPKTPESAKLLVFAYVDVPPNVSPATLEPASVAAIGPDRSFVLNGVPPGSLTILVLADKGSDGAIDPGDPIAVLDDPGRKLSGLQAGDSAVIKDLAIDAAQGRAIAAAIDVRRGATATSAAADQPR